VLIRRRLSQRSEHELRVEGQSFKAMMSGRSSKASEAELKGIARGVCVGIETVAWWAERDDRGEILKSLRIGVHHADAVVWGPV